MEAYLDGHAGDMEAVGEQGALAEHALVPGGELDLGDGECVAEVEAPVHVGEGIVAEPLGVFLAGLRGGEAGELGGRWGIYLEEALRSPAILAPALERAQIVALGGLRGASASAGASRRRADLAEFDGLRHERTGETHRGD
jgi:hypothetical protein